MTLTDWSADDLAANRAGKLSDHQLSRVRGKTITALVLWSLVAIGLVSLVGVLMIARGAGGMRIGGYATIAILLMSTLPGIVIRWTTLSPDFASRTVEKVTGVVRVRIEGDFRYLGMYKRSWQTIAVGDRGIRPMFGGLQSMDGKTATVYVLPKSNFAIAMEP